jgi:hypothetical protein
LGRKKGSYKFEKRKKELKKQKKKQEKLARRQNKSTDDEETFEAPSDFDQLFNPSPEANNDSNTED